MQSIARAFSIVLWRVAYLDLPPIHLYTHSFASKVVNVLAAAYADEHDVCLSRFLVATRRILRCNLNSTTRLLLDASHLRNEE